MRRVVMLRPAVIAPLLALLLNGAVAAAQAPAPPAQPPAGQAPAPELPALPPPAPFPEGARVAVVNLQQIAQLSVEGQASTARVQALLSKKQAEIGARTKQLQDNQNKLAQSGSLMNDTARAQLERDIERQQVDLERLQQDAQAEIAELQSQLQGEFQQKLFPVLNEMLREKGLHALFSAADSGIIWIEPGIDLTAEAIKRFDSAMAKPVAPAAAPAPATKP